MFTKQYRQELIDGEMLTYAHNEMTDTGALTGEIDTCEKQVAKLERAIGSLSETMDAMDGAEPAYGRKYRDLQKRQDKLYEEIDAVEIKLNEANRLLDGARNSELTVEEAKRFLKEFGKAIGKVDKAARRTLYAALIDSIDITPNADWKHGEGIANRIRFKLPLIYGDKRTLEVNRQEDGNFSVPDKQVGNKYFRVKENTDEAIAMLSRRC